MRTSKRERLIVPLDQRPGHIKFTYPGQYRRLVGYFGRQSTPALISTETSEFAKAAHIATYSGWPPRGRLVRLDTIRYD